MAAWVDADECIGGRRCLVRGGCLGRQRQVTGVCGGGGGDVPGLRLATASGGGGLQLQRRWVVGYGGGVGGCGGEHWWAALFGQGRVPGATAAGDGRVLRRRRRWLGLGLQVTGLCLATASGGGEFAVAATVGGGVRRRGLMRTSALVGGVVWSGAGAWGDSGRFGDGIVVGGRVAVAATVGGGVRRRRWLMRTSALVGGVVWSGAGGWGLGSM